MPSTSFLFPPSFGTRCKRVHGRDSDGAFSSLPCCVCRVIFLFCWVGLLSLFFLPRKVAFSLVCLPFSVCYVVKTRDATLCIVAETNAARHLSTLCPSPRSLSAMTFVFFLFFFPWTEKMRPVQVPAAREERNGGPR